MPLNILFIDDEPDICEVFNDTFSSEDFSVSTFTNPNEALKYSEMNQLDCAFLDYQLQDTTGDEIAFKLKGAIPKYLISGIPVKVTRYPFLKILKKPFNEKEIRDILTHLLAELGK